MKIFEIYCTKHSQVISAPDIENAIKDFMKENVGEEIIFIENIKYRYAESEVKKLNKSDVMPSLPSKDKAVDVGFNKAKNADYNYRKVLRDLDHDIYYSGWMDCFDWMVGNVA